MPARSPRSSRGPAGSPAPDPEQRRTLGAFYTPAHAADYMTGLLRDVIATSRILEPSGGDGAFLNALRRAGIDAHVDVWDKNPAVAEHLTGPALTFTCRDSLLDPPAPCGVYTHAIGNPPYLNKLSTYVKNHRTQLWRRYADIGAHDTYAMFVRMTLDQLRSGGQLVFLISHTFLTLASHRKLREHLLANTRIDSLTLLPDTTFPDAMVSTVIVNATKTPPPEEHQVRVEDLRRQPARTYDTAHVHRVPQTEWRTNPASVFVFAPEQRNVLRLSTQLPPLMSILDGGLGLYTRDYRASLGVIERDGTTLVDPDGLPVVDLRDLTHPSPGAQQWREYHKKGGESRWWGPAEHCIRWDCDSRARYDVPSSALAADTTDGSPRAGVIVSGIATSLTARMMTPGALWESNKAFALFPKDPDRHPPEFILAALNSTWYRNAARALNHTVSLQVGDLKRLPLLPFTHDDVHALAALATTCVDDVRLTGTPRAEAVSRIDAIVDAAAGRIALR